MKRPKLPTNVRVIFVVKENVEMRPQVTEIKELILLLARQTAKEYHNIAQKEKT